MVYALISSVKAISDYMPACLSVCMLMYLDTYAPPHLRCLQETLYFVCITVTSTNYYKIFIINYNVSD